MKTKTKKILLITTTIVLSLLTICGLVVSMLYCNGSLDTLQVAHAIEPPVQQGLRFNQIFGPNNIPLKLVEGGITRTPLDDGASYSGTNVSATLYFARNIKLVSEHVYYFALNITGDYYNVRLERMPFTLTPYCYISNFNGFSLNSAYFDFVKGITYNFTIQPVLVDLTYMFGEGKEPKSVAEVQKYIVPGTYYPYTPITNDYEDGYQNGLTQGLSNAQTLFKYYQYTTHIISQNNSLTLGDLISEIVPGGDYVYYHDFNFENTSNYFYTYSSNLVGYNLNGDGREKFQPYDKPIDISVSNTKPLFDGYKWLDVSTPYKLANCLKAMPKGAYLCEIWWTEGSDSMHLSMYDFNNATPKAIDNYLSINDSAYNSGYNDGLGKGTHDGYNDGYAVGHSDGVKQGIEESNNYNFFTLISAVIDAPINAVTQALDFEFLGINLKQFLFSILTIGLVLLGLRLAVGGK